MTQPWIKLPDLHPLCIHSHWALGTVQIGNSLPLLRVAFKYSGRLPILQRATIWNYLLRSLSLGTSIEPNIRINRSQGDPNLFPSGHPPCARPLVMDEKVVDIFLLRNIPLLLFLKSFKKAERHSNKTTDLSWSINCARVFAGEAVRLL